MLPLLIGYVEAKDVGIDLNQVEKTEQLKRYRESLNGNLILTNYVEFRWYVDGKQRLKVVLGERVGDEIQLNDNYVPTPEAIFYYAYAIFHNPTYRQRYAEFLKIDFPRLPLTRDNELFKVLGEKGQELVELHLMKSKKLNKLITKYSVSGDNAVTEVSYKPLEQRAYINKQQYFEGIIPEVWAFKIGGYQVLDKWLKDRKKAKRSLTFDDVLHYQRVVVALKETMQIMTEIDQLIPSWPLE
jgi:predicted helicase